MKYIGTAKELIEDAMIQLMDKQDYSKISISDVVAKAGVSRISFYRNFDSKDDILVNYLDRCLNELDAKWDDSLEPSVQLFTYFYENKKILDILYRANMQQYFYEHIVKMFKYNSDDSNIIAYSKVAWASFVFGWLDEWYKRGMQESPKEMIKLMQDTFSKQ